MLSHAKICLQKSAYAAKIGSQFAPKASRCASVTPRSEPGGPAHRVRRPVTGRAEVPCRGIRSQGQGATTFHQEARELWAGLDVDAHDRPLLPPRAGTFQSAPMERFFLGFLLGWWGSAPSGASRGWPRLQRGWARTAASRCSSRRSRRRKTHRRALWPDRDFGGTWTVMRFPVRGSRIVRVMVQHFPGLP